jgi:hypothetical protein
MRALYDREFRVIAAILAEESDLRGKLNQLDAQVADNLDVGDNALSLNVVGAQLLWQGWTSRTRRHLNGDLAQIMAKKLVAMDRVRIAFGRQRAVEMMMVTEQRTRKHRRAKQRDINLLSRG